jgi:hypothetical protein
MKWPKSRRRRKSQEKSLLVINFVTDENDPVLGFAVGWLAELRTRVDRMTVLTGRIGSVPESLDAEIISTDWVPDQNIRNVLKFQRELIRVLRSQRPNAVFTHMAAPQGLLASPLLRLTRIRHVLWYAHPQVTPMLRFAVALANRVVTSVPESFTLPSRKVVAIGQGIDLHRFGNHGPHSGNLRTFIHWGRCDPVKRLDYLAEAVDQFGRWAGVESQFIQVGNPMTDESSAWWQDVLRIDAERERPVIKWIPGVSQSELSGIGHGADAFIHACNAFDKAALEAALIGLPVFSEAESVQREVGSPPSEPSLFKQLKWWQSASLEDRSTFGNLQRSAVVNGHSLRVLALRLEELLYNGVYGD